jgi:UDP-glucuronate decarboxylase
MSSLAGSLSVQPIKTIKTNVMGTINMLGLARGSGKNLAGSTSEVYGDGDHPSRRLLGNVNPMA